MKITRKQIKQIVKEEMQRVLAEGKEDIKKEMDILIRNMKQYEDIYKYDLRTLRTSWEDSMFPLESFLIGVYGTGGRAFHGRNISDREIPQDERNKHKAISQLASRIYTKFFKTGKTLPDSLKDDDSKRARGI